MITGRTKTEPESLDALVQHSICQGPDTAFSGIFMLTHLLVTHGHTARESQCQGPSLQAPTQWLPHRHIAPLAGMWPERAVAPRH